MRIVVTGGEGFIGKNLRVRLPSSGTTHVTSVIARHPRAELQRALAEADFVFHLAGVNRPAGSRGIRRAAIAISLQLVCDALASNGRRPAARLARRRRRRRSTIHTARASAAQSASVERYAARNRAPVLSFRLTNVFGKWVAPELQLRCGDFLP